jgi:hypothetical protein
MLTKTLREKQPYLECRNGNRHVDTKLFPWDWQWERRLKSEGIKQRLVMNWDGWLLSEEKITTVPKTRGENRYVVDVWVARVYVLRPRICTSLDGDGLAGVLRTNSFEEPWRCPNRDLILALAMGTHERLGKTCRMAHVLNSDGMTLVLEMLVREILTMSPRNMVSRIGVGHVFPHAQDLRP